MNLSAANSCLKLLEEPSLNTYIFLIAADTASILPTIRSRCAKLKYNYYIDNLAAEKPIDDYYIRPLLKTTKIDGHLSYIKALSFKDRQLWSELTNNAQSLILKVCKKLIDQNISLSALEAEFLEQLMPISANHLIRKYEVLVKLTEETVNFDLELRASYILLVELMHN